MTEKVFPFLIFFKQQLKAEWAKPTANKQFPTFVRKLYELPSFVNYMLQVPLVDAPVVALQGLGLLSEDGQGAVRDNLDKRIDTALRWAHEATAVVIRASSTASLVSRVAKKK